MEEKARLRVWVPVWLCIKLVCVVLRIVCLRKLTIIGQEYKPKKGPRLINVNHYNLLEDGIILYELGQPLTMPYKKELGQLRGNRHPGGLITRFFFRGSGYFPTSRGAEGSDPLASARTRWAMRHGWMILNMPERTHHRDKLELREGKTRGMFKLAVEENCELQSAAIINGHGAIGDGFKHWLFWLKKRPDRHHMATVWGPPFKPNERGFTTETDPDGSRLLLAIMTRLAASLPQAERGFYKTEAAEFLAHSTDPDARFYRDIQPRIQVLT